MSTTGIIDYGVGNLKSVYNAVLQVGGKPLLTSTVDDLLACDRLILPGVGAFPHAINKLSELNLLDFLLSYQKSERPILGICLGMQLLLEESCEFCNTKGLGLCEGTITKLTTNSNQPIKLPNVGWYSLSKSLERPHWILDNISVDDRFYFIHSYALQEPSKHTLAESDYVGSRFASIIGYKNVVGTQFHPEKSGESGLRLISNFTNQY